MQRLKVPELSPEDNILVGRLVEAYFSNDPGGIQVTWGTAVDGSASLKISAKDLAKLLHAARLEGAVHL